MGSDLGLHGFLRSLPGTDPRNWCICWRLWIQGVDRGWPGWENQEAQCRNCKRKTCDDGHHRHVFPGGHRCCERIVCSNSPRKETPQRVWIRKHNFVWFCLVCSEFLKFVFASHILCTSHVWLSEIVSAYCATVCYSAMSLVYLHTLTSKMSCRLYLERVVTKIRLWIWYHTVETCVKTWQIWWVIFVLLTKCVCTKAVHVTPFHITPCCIIPFKKNK